MATKTLGTSATNSLTALSYAPGAMSAADIASIAQAIKGSEGSIVPEAFSENGLLYLPKKKGVIRMDPGDWVGVDPTTGWPIMVAAYAIAGGPWTHS